MQGKTNQLHPSGMTSCKRVKNKTRGKVPRIQNQVTHTSLLTLTLHLVYTMAFHVQFRLFSVLFLLFNLVRKTSGASIRV